MKIIPQIAVSNDYSMLTAEIVTRLQVYCFFPTLRMIKHQVHYENWLTQGDCMHVFMVLNILDQYENYKTKK